MKNPNMDQGLLSDVLKAVSEDRLYDKKSILWDGSKMQVITDELDSGDILDGRFGPFMRVKIETALGITLYSFSTMHNKELFSGSWNPAADNSEEYSIETENRYLSLKKYRKDEYGLLLEVFSKDAGLIELENGSIMTADNSQRIFSGLIETLSGTVMIGYLLLSTGSGDNTFSLVYAGLGNYSDIQVEAMHIMDSFKKKNRA